MIKGYKAFNKNFTNRYGRVYEVGEIFSASGEVKFGNSSHGIHFCTNLEDVFRYFDAINEEVIVAEVSTNDDGENITKYDDEYYGYYDMYACRNMKIEKVLSREEIFDLVMKKNEHSIKKFLSTYKLNTEEKEKFLLVNKSSFLKQIFDYYQSGEKPVR